MSIATEITRLQNAKSALKSTIENKGVTVPSSTKLDGYASLVNSIPDASEATKVAIIVDKGTESIYNEDNELVPIISKAYTLYGLSYQNVDIPALSGSGVVNFAVNSSTMDDQTYGTWIWLSPVDGILWDDLTQFSLEDNLSHQSTTIQDIQYIKETPSDTSKFGVAIRAKLTGDTNIFYKGNYLTQITVM